MTNYRVIALPESISHEVRATGRSPKYGHPTHVEVAAGYGPCRSCLRTFREGEENRVLFTVDPFDGLEDYPSPGPVFIHEDACEEYREVGLPAEIAALPLVFEGYGEKRWMVDRAMPTSEDIDASLKRLLGNPEIRYVHVRNAEAGCYIARVERA